jgi:hypothetical protein
MLLSYTTSLLIFAALNTLIFLLSYVIPDKARIVIFTILVLDLLLFSYILIIHDWTFIKTYELFLLIAFSISISLTALTYFIISSRGKSPQHYAVAIIIGIVLLDTVLEYLPSITDGFIEVSEQTPDATAYMTYGHWGFSLKNPFYNIINVSSYWIALLHMVLGIGNVMYDIPNVMLYNIIALLIMLPVYVTYRRFRSINSTPIAAALVLATPYLTLITVPPALSAMYAVLAIMLLVKEEVKFPDYVAILLLSITGILTHATAIGILLFGTAALYLISRLYKVDNSKSYLNVLVLITVIYLVISIARFIYASGAYISIYPYYADFLRFLNFLYSPSTVELRVTRYGEYAPLFTSFSWTIYPALAASYVVSLLLLRRRLERNETLSFSLLGAGLLLIFLGFVLSHFSNSFSRESAYPGYILLLLGSFEPLRQIVDKGNKTMKVILFIILFLAIFSGMFTIKNASWIYIGKVPYLSYEPPTPSEILMAKNLLELAGTNSITHLKIYQDFDPSVYTVELIKWRSTKLSTISSLNIQIQRLTNITNITNENIIFDTSQLVVSSS